jgi:hypothetical protein
MGEPGETRRGGFWAIVAGLITAVGTLITALATAGIISANRDADQGPVATFTSSQAPVSARQSQPPPETTQPLARFTVIVGIRPQLGQLTENVELLLDGGQAATWTADQANPQQTLQLEARPGRHRYQFRGTYTWVNPLGVTQRALVNGQGSVQVVDGARLVVVYRAPAFFLEPAPA